MTKTNKHQDKALFPLLAVNFIGTLGYSLVIPFLVYIVTRFGGNEVVYGLMGATYSFFQLFGAFCLPIPTDCVLECTKLAPNQMHPHLEQHLCLGEVLSHPCWRMLNSSLNPHKPVQFFLYPLRDGYSKLQSYLGRGLLHQAT